MKFSSSRGRAPDVARRRLVQGLTASGIAAASGLTFLCGPGRAQSLPGQPGPQTLSGTEFDLTLSDTPMNLSGRISSTTCVNGSIPAPTLRWREGTTVTLRVHNQLAHSSSIHWHGVLLPFDMDGVPGISFPGIPAGEAPLTR